ncbi:MAG: sigma-54-dependent Fis family transcriptional regulator [Myxococcales bacterium]|nr:sigma-54-dependent Fis family transcriptional regulator [Myxococcales bacterium]
MSAHVLLADDEALILSSLRGVLLQEGFEVTVASSGEQAWQHFVKARPDVVLLDLILGDITGIEVLRRIRQLSPETKVILISAHATLEQAVEAMKLGGHDFIRKPFELEEIVTTVRNAARISELEGRLDYLARRARQHSDSSGLLFASSIMASKLREIELFARSPVQTVLIQGESGTGKQLVAQLLHERSSRSHGPLVELNCSTLPETLVESELFGHERGAFSDARERKLGLCEIADGGTLFLDEVGDLSASAQAKLLTFLEQRTFRRVGATAVRKVDVRVVAATHRDLRAMAADKTFRGDLLFRLNAMTVELPPLRERPDDILLLSEHFLRAASHEFRRSWQGVSKEAQALLVRYAWPGNVRELKAMISRAALLYDDVLLRPEHLPSDLTARAVPPHQPVVSEPADAPIATLAEVELAHIRRVLSLCGGNRTLAAQKLGVTRQTLSRKLEESGPT